MSLHNLAEQVRSQGRNGDSMLIHMTPGEVGGLQALAQNYGGSLTINPQTGLPEASFLKNILPTLLGVGLSFIPGVGPLAAAGLVGGGTALATGNLQKGLLAGLGAYGGAGLGGALSSLGAATPAAAASAMGVPGAATGAGSQAAMLASQNAGFGAEGLAHLAGSAGGTAPSSFSLFGEGVKQAAGAPGAFLKSNLANIGMAAAPVLGGAFDSNSQQQTPEPEGNIRQFDYAQEINPNFGMPGQPYFIQKYTPGETTPVSQFKGFAEGGIAQLEGPYTRQQRQVDPAVTEYNQALMQRAQTEYNQSPQLAAFRSALPNQGAYDPQAGEAFRALQQQQAERAKEMPASQFGFKFDPATNRVFKDPSAEKKPAEDQIQSLQRQIEELQRSSNPYQYAYDISGNAAGGAISLGSYSDGGRLLRGPGDGVSDNIPATINDKQPARLADGEFVVPARIVSELGNGSTDAGARKLYAMMDRVQKARNKTVGKDKVAVNSRAAKELPA
jgi:hypothetical protein